MFQADILQEQRGFAVFMLRHLWREPSDSAECSINFGKPAVWKVAHKAWGAAVSVLMKCSASGLFRTINTPLPLFEMQHALVLDQRHVWSAHSANARRAVRAVLSVNVFNPQFLLWCGALWEAGRFFSFL